MSKKHTAVVSPREERKEQYRVALSLAAKEGNVDMVMRELALKDLFFLGVYILDCGFADNDWVFARCEEFSKDRDGYLDLWPREHFKSVIITLWGITQEILRDPEITVGIFSFNRPIAKQFLRVIKWQFERNEKLKELFSDILYADPQKESLKWSEDEGIIVKRKTNPKEMTIEAWGLVDGQPTSKHYKLIVYDDVETVTSVSSVDMIKKTTEALSISFNLGSIFSPRRWMIGTIYHFADTYTEMMRRGAVKIRKYAATKDGTFHGEPWLWDKETLANKIRDMGPYVASCQLFNNPVAEGEQVFLPEWIQYWSPNLNGKDTWANMNRYILVDPANEKKATSDYTVMAVIGLGPDKNYYLIDLVRDKMNMEERATRLFALHQKYQPLHVGYEKYGIQSDIDYIKERQNMSNYRFRIIPLGGSLKKNDRIKRLQPLFSEGRFYIPETIVHEDYQGMLRDVIKSFIEEEYSQFPYMTHDDMLDCMSRIAEEDLFANFPIAGSVNDSPYSDRRENEYDFDTYAYLDA